MRTTLRAAACGAGMAMLGLAAPAHAVSLVATSSNFASVFAAATAGDTIILKGNFGKLYLADRTFSTPLRIDARDATFSGTMNIRRLSGLSVIGGRFGDGTGIWQDAGTVSVSNSSNISFTQPTMTAAGLGKARGFTFVNTRDFNVSDGTFSGFRLAIGSIGSTDGTVTNNRITRSTSDGINIANSHRITASGNHCSGGIPTLGAHPDCIQLWSISGQPPQSDIKLLYNTAIGNTQGFTSFDADKGGGLRISMIGNRVDTSMPQGITCYGCFDSIITDNVLTTLPGARWFTRINVIGGGNNIVANNSVGGLPPPPPPSPLPPGSTPPTPGLSSLSNMALEAGQMSLADFEGSAWTNDFDMLAGLTGVPEPATWLQLLTGFALLGVIARRRSGQLGHQKAC